MATGLDGTKASAFFASPKSKPKQPQVLLRDEKEGVIGMPFLRTDAANVPYGGQIKVNTTLDISFAAVVGSFIKAAHLAIFRLTGYDWVFNDAGKYLAKHLRNFVQERGTTASAGRYFKPFHQCIHVRRGEHPDTLNDGVVYWHLDEEGRYVWGSSALFRINGDTFMVTVPRAVNTDFDVAVKTYEACAAAAWKSPRKFAPSP